MAEPWAIETRGLTKRYKQYDAVCELNLQVPAQGITAFLGRNGAGKSTTLRMLLGITRPSSGTGLVLGRRVDRESESIEIRRRIAFVAEDKQTYRQFTVGEMISWTKAFYRDWRDDLASQVARQWQLRLDQEVGKLSKGQRTKLALLLALARRPQLLILDEPNEGLDAVAAEELLGHLEAAKEDGTPVFFSSHQIEYVERMADRVCIIDGGRLMLQVTAKEIRESFRRITLRLGSAETGGAFLEGGAVFGVQRVGDRMRFIATRNSDSILRRAGEAGVVVVACEPIGLREVFLECVLGVR
jgi:ABC-2 type transport system ATP-binding protein